MSRSVCVSTQLPSHLSVTHLASLQSPPLSSASLGPPNPSMSAPTQLAKSDPAKLESEAIRAWEKAFGEKWPPAGAPPMLKGVTEFNAVFLPIMAPYQAAVTAFFRSLPDSQCANTPSCIAAVSSYPAINASFLPTEKTTVHTRPLFIAESEKATGCALVAWQDAAPSEPTRPGVRHWRLLYSQQLRKK